MKTSVIPVLESLCRSLTNEMSRCADVSIEPLPGMLGGRPAAEAGYVMMYINGEYASVMRVNPNPGRQEYMAICSALHENIQKWLKCYTPRRKPVAS